MWFDQFGQFLIFMMTLLYTFYSVNGASSDCTSHFKLAASIFKTQLLHPRPKMASKLDPNPNPFFILPTPYHSKPQTHLSQNPAALSAAADTKLVITGGNNLSGHVSISGSKNSALSILAATLCCSGTSKLKNVPNLSDTTTMASILGSLGAEIEFSDNEVVVNTDRVGSVEPDAALIGRIRGGFFVIGPLLARFGEAVLGLPGGCDIGARPVDIYVRGLRELGAVVEMRFVNFLRTMCSVLHFTDIPLLFN